MDIQAESHGAFWGDRTSSIDWCEENYVVSPYIAEFWNTLSNLAIIIPAGIGLKQALQDQAEARFAYGYAMLCVVGVGSWLFHMTLLFSMQMCDEVPMLWGTSVATYCLIESRAPPNSYNKRLAASQLLVTAAVTGVCATTRDPRVFPICFGAFILVLTIQCVIAVRTQKCNSNLVKLGMFIYFLGAIMWVIDRNQCQILSNVRNLFPPSIQPVLQLHGWWHVFAGMASMFIMVFIYDIRCRELKHPYRIGMKWHCIPYLEVDTKTRKEV